MAGPALAAFALAGLFVPAFAFDTAEASERVGVAAAVTPDATSQPPGEETRTLKIGKSVVYDERIDTSSSGVVQVLLLDGSTFTVGPGSSLVIDKFVYDPKSGKGSLVASFSKGALRFVGGKLSKDEPGISVKTPAGVLTVRGGMFQGWIAGPNKALIAFLYGNHLSLARGGQLYTHERDRQACSPSPVPARRSSGPRPSPIPVSCSPPSPARRSNMPRRPFR